MTQQLEETKVVGGAPVKYVRTKFRGQFVRVPVQAVRRTCEICGQEYWAWPDDFDWACAKCRLGTADTEERIYVGRSL